MRGLKSRSLDLALSHCDSAGTQDDKWLEDQRSAEAPLYDDVQLESGVHVWGYIRLRNFFG